MTRPLGLLVIDRSAFRERLESGGLVQDFKLPLSLSLDEVFRRYRGFEGNLWKEEAHPEVDTENGLAALHSMDRVRAYLRRCDPQGRCDLLAIGWPSSESFPK